MLEVIRTIENLQKNPQRAKEVYNLYFGDSTDGEEISAGVIDAARIAQICAYNCFSSDDSVRMLNENCHLFILPSYFNHSCIANAHRNIYGDVMVIHASTNIKKGDEICLAYIHPLTHDRKKSLNCWNFTCQCYLCKADAKDEQCSKRSHIFNEFVKYSTNQNAPQTVTEKREALLKQMRKTYDNQNKFKIHLAKMLTDLSSNYFDMGNTKRCIKYLEEVINLMQDPLEYVLEDVRVNLGICYYSNGETSKAKEMMQKAFELSICNDMDHFKLIYPEVAKLI
uniref:SET domain-containing protein n=1 Tax=Panagrolaimus superbus TaxID=310955 RepID=A0A914YKT8_9BILA